MVAEDHTILRDGLKAILAQDSTLTVVCEAADGLEAIRCAASEQPDLVLLDVSMPRMSGLDALKEIGRVAPDARVIVLTVHKTEEYVQVALKAGAWGYVLKDASSSELLFAVHSVLAGQRYISPQVAGAVVAGYLGGKGLVGSGSSLELLSNREREVLKLIAEGYRNREVGNLLCISEKTVEKHRATLMRKLGLRGAQALTAFAIEKGLVSR